MFSKTSKGFFFNDVYVKIYTDPLLDDFKSDNIIFFIFLNFSSSSSLNL